jgi:hypothetical protein
MLKLSVKLLILFVLTGCVIGNPNTPNSYGNRQPSQAQQQQQYQPTPRTTQYPYAGNDDLYYNNNYYQGDDPQSIYQGGYVTQPRYVVPRAQQQQQYQQQYQPVQQRPVPQRQVQQAPQRQVPQQRQPQTYEDNDNTYTPVDFYFSY